MAEKKSYKKPVTYEVAPDEVPGTYSTLDKQSFDTAVYARGYDVYFEKALKCSCVIKANGDALPNCRNCGGTKWIFVNKRKTKAITQSMNKQTKFLNWSETDRGTISVTVRDCDKLAFMDRLTNLNLVSTYAETVQIRLIDNRLVAFTIYPIIVPTECYLFVSSDKPLKQLQIVEDFTLEDNKIILNSKYKNLDVEETTVAVRYTHFPQYHILDIPRDAVAVLGGEHSCSNPEVNDQYANLPIHAVARKAHYCMDEPSARGEGLFDNTYIPNNTLNFLLESIPFSLDYWLAKSTSKEILEALINLDDNDKKNYLLDNL